MMKAPAKVNLMLHVTGRRADGYHLLQSLVMFAGIGDTLTLAPADDFSLTVDGEFADALTGDNLISKVAARFGAKGHITLTKNIPVGAGLGGGSADAAAAIRLLSLPTDGKELGSDVPACLLGTPLWMEDTGTRLTPVAVPFDVPVLLVNPRVHVATQEVYQLLQPPYSAPISLPDAFANMAALLAFLHNTHNALEAPALAISPEIATVLSALRALADCGLARMSGSGSTCFGIFPSKETCNLAATALQAAHPHWWIRATILQGK